MKPVHKARLYECQNCGYRQLITTTHEGSCLDYCGRAGGHGDRDDNKGGCSWKPSWKGPGEDTHSYPLFGRTYRSFKFVKGS